MKVCIREPEQPLFQRRRKLKQRSGIMFKIIGASIVYGFALFGLAKYFEAASNDS